MNNWFSIGDDKGVVCCGCNSYIKMSYGGLDHHPSKCPNCGLNCVLILWNKWIQISTNQAPNHFKSFIYWAQKELDELEFVELLSNFEEIAEQINS